LSHRIDLHFIDHSCVCWLCILIVLNVAGIMDDLTASLAGSFCVSVTPNNIAAPHPRFTQYKCKTDFASQSERRRRYLELQKQCVNVTNLYLVKSVQFVNMLSLIQLVCKFEG